MRIMVVDDSKLNLAMVEQYLKGFQNITEIILCNKPESVQQIIDEKEIDILLLDVVMPVMSGFDILKMLRRNKKYDDIYVIILTSLTDNESFMTGFELGAYDYINKPINLIEFNARIKVAIDLKINSNSLKEMITVTQKQNNELKEINVKLSDTKIHMVQSDKMAAIGQMAAGIAHEINNPMGFINNNFQILSKYYKRISEYLLLIDEKLDTLISEENEKINPIIEEILDKRKKMKIEVIQSEILGLLSESENGVQRVTDIIQSLRVFARTANNDEIEECNLLEIINQIVLISRNEIKYVSNINIDIPDDIFVYCNKVQIGQVLINILVNAAQAIKSQKRSELGNILIAANADDKYINISISDDGPGIPEEVINKIFNPFFTTKDVGQGTGLGLSISYDIIVKKHNGFISVNSQVGKGAVFTIKLPTKTT